MFDFEPDFPIPGYSDLNITFTPERNVYVVLRDYGNDLDVPLYISETLDKAKEYVEDTISELKFIDKNVSWYFEEDFVPMWFQQAPQDGKPYTGFIICQMKMNGL